MPISRAACRHNARVIVINCASMPRKPGRSQPEMLVSAASRELSSHVVHPAAVCTRDFRPRLHKASSRLLSASSSRRRLHLPCEPTSAFCQLHWSRSRRRSLRRWDLHARHPLDLARPFPAIRSGKRRFLAMVLHHTAPSPPTKCSVT
jgi:hypothetical protein